MNCISEGSLLNSTPAEIKSKKFTHLKMTYFSAISNHCWTHCNSLLVVDSKIQHDPSPSQPIKPRLSATISNPAGWSQKKHTFLHMQQTPNATGANHLCTLLLLMQASQLRPHVIWRLRAQTSTRLVQTGWSIKRLPSRLWFCLPPGNTRWYCSRFQHLGHNLICQNISSRIFISQPVQLRLILCMVMRERHDEGVFHEYTAH